MTAMKIWMTERKVYMRPSRIECARRKRGARRWARALAGFHLARENADAEPARHQPSVRNSASAARNPSGRATAIPL
jgi:hypothetical protein